MFIDLNFDYEKKKLYFLIFVSILGFSQPKKSNSLVTFGLISSFVNQRWNFGYIQKVNRTLWIGAEIGYGKKGLVIDPESITEDYESFEIRPAIYYSLSPDSVLKHFIGVDTFYIQTNKSKNSFNFYDDYQYYWASFAEMNRKKIGMNLTYSILLHKELSHIAFMPKIGIGVRNLNTQFYNIQNLTRSNPPTDGFPLFSDAPKEGTHFNIDIDIKLIYKF